jgi:polyhydroxyalkanoate synthase
VFLQGAAATGQAWADRASGLGRFLQDPPRVEVGETPSDVVYTENKLRLLHYKSPGVRHAPPILIVYALINRPYILDLQHDRSVVKHLLDRGFDVYLIDWGAPSQLDQSLTLHDYVGRYISNCVDVVLERSGEDALSLLGYCMGGSMSVMYAALHPQKVRNLMLMAAPLVFTKDGGLLHHWSRPQHFDVDNVIDTLGNAPGSFLDGGFQLLKPVENLVSKYVNFARFASDRDFIENFLRMEEWSRDTIPVAGETYRQFVKEIYQQNRLARNELWLDGRAVDLAKLKMPLLLLMGQYDHLVTHETTAPFLDLVPSEDKTSFLVPTGHIGLSVSSRSHRELWPKVSEWLAARSESRAGVTEGH